MKKISWDEFIKECEVQNMKEAFHANDPYIAKLEAELKAIKHDVGYICGGASGRQSANECCGGCYGCLEMQMHHGFNGLEENNKKLESDNKKLLGENKGLIESFENKYSLLIKKHNELVQVKVDNRKLLECVEFARLYFTCMRADPRACTLEQVEKYREQFEECLAEINEGDAK